MMPVRLLGASDGRGTIGMAIQNGQETSNSAAWRAVDRAEPGGHLTQGHGACNLTPWRFSALPRPGDSTGRCPSYQLVVMVESEQTGSPAAGMPDPPPSPADFVAALPPVTAAAKARAQPVIDWITDVGRLTPGSADLVSGLGDALVAAGFPIFKVLVGVRQLHPELFAVLHVWDAATRSVLDLGRRHGVQDTPAFRRSPIPALFAGAELVRGAPNRWPWFQELLGGLEGFEQIREFAMVPLIGSGGQRSVFGVWTDHADGLADEFTAGMSLIAPVLAMALEGKANAELAANLLDVYVGTESGQRILAGDIRRGSGHTIQAVVWFCDLAEFTARSERTPRDTLIGLLNRFFDTTCRPVTANGGEILKFMGDGVLAIFRLPEDGEGRRSGAARALAAARAAVLAMDAWNRERLEAGEDGLHFGLALHAGNVMYGNVGTARRLDFTVIGPAVNQAARLQALARRLGRSVVLSAAFARELATPLPSLGRHRLRGVSRRVQIYALPHDAVR